MNLMNIKDCYKCSNSLVYGNKDNCKVQCISEESTAKELFNKDGRYCAAYCKLYKQSNKNRNGLISINNAIEFMLAGNSEFILHSTKTNDDFRFKLKITDDSDFEKKIIYFVNIIKANSNIYAGTIWFDKENREIKFSKGEKGKISSSNIEVRSLLFVINKLLNRETIQHLQIYSLGKCGCCGKYIEADEEADNFIHKDCYNNIHIKEFMEKQ